MWRHLFLKREREKKKKPQHYGRRKSPNRRTDRRRRRKNVRKKVKTERTKKRERITHGQPYRERWWGWRRPPHPTPKKDYVNLPFFVTPSSTTHT